MTMNLVCPALDKGGRFPGRCARGGVPDARNSSPPLSWNEVPAGTESFVLTVIDRHPIANNWVHWCVADIPSSVRELQEGASRDAQRMPPPAVELANTFGDRGYGGPQPPPGTGPHEYVITLYALTVPALKLAPRATLSDVRSAMEKKILDSAMIVGVFER